ncbi:MAG: hypothetical protein RIC03_03100 [Cyclobacteriaceae bacterium]
MNVFLKYLTIYAISTFKFILGPALGMSYGFGVLETALLTLAGMMTTVYVFSYFGLGIRKLTSRLFKRKRKKVFTPRNRRFVRLWQLYGVRGIAFFTPILLSPPIGAILANAFGGKKEDIIKWMWIFGTFFSFVMTLILKYASWLLSDFITIP